MRGRCSSSPGICKWPCPASGSVSICMDMPVLHNLTLGLWNCLLISFPLSLPFQGIDITHRYDRKARRLAPKSKDIYLLLLVKVSHSQIICILLAHFNNLSIGILPCSCTASCTVAPRSSSTASFCVACS